MRKSPGSLSIIAILLVAVPALATPARAEQGPLRFEISPYAAFRLGGRFEERDGDGRVDLKDSRAEGFMVDVLANPNGQYEFIYARQRTDAVTSGLLAGDPNIRLDQEQFQVGGTYLFDGEKTRPFVALTLGATRFDPSLPGAGDESYFSASLGAGVQLNARQRLGIRLEARVFTTFVDDDSELFCSSIGGAGSCQFQAEARTLTQWEARAGLVFRF